MTARSRTFWTWMLSLLLVASLMWTCTNSRLYKEGETSVALAAELPAATDTESAAHPETDDESVAEDAWVVLHGTVTAYTADGETALTIQTDAGETLEMELGPAGYWLANGIALSPGDEVRIRGFYEETFEPAEIDNLTTGESVILRDDSGAPLWRGSH